MKDASFDFLIGSKIHYFCVLLSANTSEIFIFRVATAAIIDLEALPYKSK